MRKAWHMFTCAAAAPARCCVCAALRTRGARHQLRVVLLLVGRVAAGHGGVQGVPARGVGSVPVL